MSYPLSNKSSLPAAAKAADDALEAAAKLQNTKDRADSTLVKNIDWVSDNVLAKGKAAYDQYEKVESTLESLQEPAGAVMDAMSDSNDAVLRSIADNVSSWAERSEALWKALDGVAQIHPFIGVAVIAFKTAVQLELQRRDNDRKIGVLRVQRMDMMAVLCDLQHVSDNAAVEDDTRLADLIQKTANDIKECTQVCDKYLQKKLVVKLLKSNSWATKLTAFGTTFSNRKSEFQFALSIYTSKGVEKANEAIGDVQGTVDATQNKIDMLLLFKMIESPTERAMMEQIEAKGGATKVMANDDLLKELLDAFPSATSSSAASSAPRIHTKGVSSDDGTNLQSLKKDLNENIDSMLQKERGAFEAKFEVQMKQITELQTQVTRESDRVITTLLAGPGDRIKDKALHRMWKDMGWKTSARTTRFVLVLRDYYIEQYEEEPLKDTTPSGEIKDKEYVDLITATVPEGDKWALSYIGFTRLQPISEAFDDDASGFVTVQELNKFTSARPVDWSLPHWMAFWAVGWHLSLDHYAKKLNRSIIPAMLKLAGSVLPPNKGRVNRYLTSINFRDMNSIILSVTPSQDSDHLLERFQKYIDAEEKRLEGNLKPLKYEIDALNTLTLVTGHGRFERFLFPLLYLVLSHHYRLIELCTREIVSEQEFLTAADTLGYIWDGAEERMNTMKAVYEQQHIDAKVQFERTAHGIFNYVCSFDKFEAKELKSEYPTVRTNEAPVSGKLDTKDLKYPVTQADSAEIDSRNYESVVVENTESPTTIDSPLAPFVGWWDGIEHMDNSTSGRASEFEAGRITLYLEIGGDGRLSGFGIDSYDSFTLLTVAGGDTEGTPTLRRTYLNDDEEFVEFTAKLSDDGNFVGKWKSTSEHGRHTLERRSSSAIYRPRPSPDEFKENRGKVLWSIARTAVLQHLWSWTYFKERRDARKKFISLYESDDILYDWSDFLDIPTLSDDQIDELDSLKVTLSTRDQHFYRSITKRSIHRDVRHTGWFCDSCDNGILGIRYICATCLGKTLRDTIDLCTDHWDAKVARGEITHNISHPLFKARSITDFRDLLRLRNRAKSRVSAIQRLLSGGDKTGEKTIEESDTDEDDEGSDDDDSDDDSKSDDDDKDDDKDGPHGESKCIACQKEITAPCYTCMDDKCSVGSAMVLICDDCERGEKVSEWKTSTHTLEHLLLRIPAPGDAKASSKETDTDPNAVHTKITTLERRYTDHASAVEQRFDKMEARMTRFEDRMTGLEDLLHKLAVHLNLPSTSA